MYGVFLYFSCIFQTWPGAGDLAEEVKKSVLRHLWYLTEPMITLALFDMKLSNDVRGRIARKLNDTRRPANFPPGKPSFPTNRLRQSRNGEVKLEALVGPKSWLLFDLLGANDDWLALNPDEWDADLDYTGMSAIVKQLEVVNDGAERSIKDIQEYADSAKDSQQRGEIILVSSSHRVKLPEFHKNEMDNQL